MKKTLTLQISAGVITTSLLFTGYILLRNKKREGIAKKLLKVLSPKLNTTTKKLSSEKALDVNYANKVLNTIPFRIVLLKKSSAIDYAREIHKAFRAWYQGGDDESSIYAVFRSLKDKIQVSQVAKAYQNEFNQNLQHQLQEHFDKSEIKTVLSIISQLPDYRKV